jgi:hypothetical protein
MATHSDSGLMSEDWAVVRSLLPDGWREQARSSGALRRARGVDGPETLLRILLLHLAAGYSLSETAVRARRTGLGQLSAVALFKRVQASEQWLRWLAAAERDLLVQGSPVSERRLRAVDATVVSEPGSTGTDWRIHYAINLTDLQCDFFELTDAHGGETWRRVPVLAGDVLLGDRAYGTPPGVAHVVAAKGDVLVRISVRLLPLHDAGRTQIKILQAVRGLRVGQVLDLPTWVRSPDGTWISGRLVALRRSAQATRMVQRKLLRAAQRQQRRVSPESLKAAQYLLLWTTLGAEVSAPEVCEYYRWRWQIELGFKRMKSILGLGHLPKKDPASARAWLHGKLLTSLLVERMIQQARAFSPWGYRLDSSTEPVA